MFDDATDKDRMFDDIVTTLNFADNTKRAALKMEVEWNTASTILNFNIDQPNSEVKSLFDFRQLIDDLTKTDIISGPALRPVEFKSWETVANSYKLVDFSGPTGKTEYYAYGSSTATGDILLALNIVQNSANVNKFKYVSDLSIGQELNRSQMYSLGFTDKELGLNSTFVITGYRWAQNMAGQRDFQGRTRYQGGGMWSKDNPLSDVYGLKYTVAAKVYDDIVASPNMDATIMPSYIAYTSNGLSPENADFNKNIINQVNENVKNITDQVDDWMKKQTEDTWKRIVNNLNKPIEIKVPVPTINYVPY